MRVSPHASDVPSDDCSDPQAATYWIRTIAVAAFDALAIWVIAQLAVNRSWAVMVL